MTRVSRCASYVFKVLPGRGNFNPYRILQSSCHPTWILFLTQRACSGVHQSNNAIGLATMHFFQLRHVRERVMEIVGCALCSIALAVMIVNFQSPPPQITLVCHHLELIGNCDTAQWLSIVYYATKLVLPVRS